MGLDDPSELLRAYSELSGELSRGLATYKGKYWPREPLQTLAHFSKYAASYRHEYTLKKLTGEESALE